MSPMVVIIYVVNTVMEYVSNEAMVYVDFGGDCFC